MIHLTFSDLKGFVYKKKDSGNNKYYIKGGMRKVINIYRNEHPCEKCGVYHSISPLTFHHTKSKSKRYNISDLRQGRIELSTKRFLKEINQCELLCNICHKLEHL